MPQYEDIDLSDLEPIKIQVKMNGRKYVLREATHSDVCKYKNAMLRCTKIVNGAPSEIQGAANIDAQLLSFCLFERVPANTANDTQEKDIPVSEEFIRSLNDRKVSVLVEKLKVISGLSEEEDTIEGLGNKIALLNIRRDRLLGQNSDQDGMNGSSEGDSSKNLLDGTTPPYPIPKN